jgi:hypothetical protein
VRIKGQVKLMSKCRALPKHLFIVIVYAPVFCRLSGTSRKLPGTQQLIFYAGRQGYEPPEDAHPFIYGPAGGNFSAVQRTKEAPLRCREGFFRTVYVKIFRLRESFDLE